MLNSHFAIRQFDGAIDLRLERFRNRFAFANEVAYLIAVSRTVCFGHLRFIQLAIACFAIAQSLNQNITQLLTAPNP
jgi:hypothetical protein